MLPGNDLAAGEVGYGACHLQQPIIAAHGHLELFVRGAQQRLRVGGQDTPAFDAGRRDAGIGRDAGTGKAFLLDTMGGVDPLPYVAFTSS